MSASRNVARSISPSATAAPSALAARDSPIDLSVSVVAMTAPRAGGFADALRGQQRALELNEMHVGRVRNARIAHRGAHAIGHLVDLRQAAEMLGRQRRRVGAADGERRSLAGVARRALEHDPVRRHAAFGAARHHEADRRRIGLGKVALEQQFSVSVAKPRLKSLTRPLPSVFAENGDHALRIDPAVARSRPRCRETSSGASAEMRWTLAIGMMSSGQASLAARRFGFEMRMDDALKRLQRGRERGVARHAGAQARQAVRRACAG